MYRTRTSWEPRWEPRVQLPRRGNTQPCRRPRPRRTARPGGRRLTLLFRARCLKRLARCPEPVGGVRERQCGQFRGNSIAMDSRRVANRGGSIARRRSSTTPKRTSSSAVASFSSADREVCTTATILRAGVGWTEGQRTSTKLCEETSAVPLFLGTSEELAGKKKNSAGTRMGNSVTSACVVGNKVQAKSQDNIFLSTGTGRHQSASRDCGLT